jgi:hypothetical protein
MGERPILFSGAMVRALLAGTKTQTRRLSGLPTIEEVLGFGWHIHNRHGGVLNVDAHNVGKVAAEMLAIQPGDRLWVREAWQADTNVSHLPPRDIKPGSPIWYPADNSSRNASEFSVRALSKTRPGMFMPRWASRLTLTVTDVRVERLQDISEADALAEGMTQATADAIMSAEELALYASTLVLCADARGRILYETLWDAINGPGSWEANPWIAAYTFTVEQQNIDAGDQP